MTPVPAIRILDISKTYGGVKALKGVSFDIEAGEVHALCGENGAGKSTLNKVLCGAVLPEQGAIEVDGQRLKLGSVKNSEEAGIAIVHQESVAFQYLGADDNVFVGHEPTQAFGLWLNKKAMREEVRLILERLGEGFDPSQPLIELSVAQRQMVGIARALSRKCKLLILDEPTSSLSERETEALFRVVRQLKQEGVSILYVSHRLAEVFELADRVTVLRDGAYVDTKNIKDVDGKGLIKLMVGREVAFERYSGATGTLEALKVENLGRSSVFEGVSFGVKAGEVVGLAGLVGAGRSEVAQAICGIKPATSGTITVFGTPERIRNINDTMKMGIGYVPEDRQHQGLALPMSVSENLTLASLEEVSKGPFLSSAKETELAQQQISAMEIKTESPSSPVESLSGGNQQKVLLGKWLAKNPRILILDEPTRGVDVGAKTEVHKLIEGLKAQGIAIILISSELPEILALSDRVVVMREGRKAGELSGEQATQERILELALPDKLIEQTAVRQDKPQSKLKTLISQREYGVALILFLTVLAVTLVNPPFIEPGNIRDMLLNIAPVAIIGCGVTLVILCREIDISVGANMGFTAALMGLAATKWHMPPPASIALMLAAGAGIGLLNGILVALSRIPSIIVTLGMMTIIGGVTPIIMGGKTIPDIPESLRFWGTGSIGDIRVAILVAVLVAVLTYILTVRTPIGRRIYAVGNSPRAALLAGVSNKRIRLFVFALTGFLAALASLVSATQLGTVDSGYGIGKEMLVVTCVVVGGTSIRGGKGSVIGTIIGACLLCIVPTVLIFFKLGEMSTYWERGIQGAFILVAVLWDHILRRGERS